MPPKRRKIHERDTNEDLESICNKITELLLVVKPNLAQTAQVNAKSLIQDLNAIAELAESFTKARTSTSSGDPMDFADQLDLEGVGLWNSATYLKTSDAASTEIYAAVRYAGFRLIEAGMDVQPTEEALVNILELSSKVGMGFADAESELADEILTNAASYERTLDEMPQGEDASSSRNRARAIVTYYTSRMDAAWRQNNLDVAGYMMSKIQDDQIDKLATQDVELVVHKMMDIGRSIIKGENGNVTQRNEPERALQSLKWMKRAFSIVDKGDKESAVPPALRRMILRGLARAYYISSASMPENLERAEVALKEVFDNLEQSEDKADAEYQRLRWMSLAILKKREATEDELLAVLLPLIEHISLTEESVQETLSELRTVSKNHFHVATKTLQHLLSRSVQVLDGHQIADKILLALIIHMKGSKDHTTTVVALKAALIVVSTAEAYELDPVSATACLTLIWQFGDQEYNQKKWNNAADWYLLGSHEAFNCVSDLAGSKCIRKAALCHIQSGQYASASTLIERCSKKEAATCYLAFLAAAHQGQTEEATRAVQLMIKAQDFDRKMLFLATNLAREVQNRQLLHSVLEALLETLKTGEGNAENQGMTVIRCLVRLVLQMLEEPAADLKRLLPVLRRHFQTATTLAADAIKQKNKALIRKDMSWLWRVAYNAAVSGLGVWDDAEVTSMFDMSRRLMEVSCEVSLLEPEPDLCVHRVMASFAAISGKLFAVRDRPETPERVATMRKILEDIDKLQEYMKSIPSQKEDKEKVTERLSSVHHLVLVYQAELLAEIEEWERLLAKVQEANNAKTLSVITMEAIADILWSHKACPVPVLFGCLETILCSTTQRGSLSVKKFSRWLRAVCSILLSRGRGTDRNKALAYMHQAVDVLKDHSEMHNAVSDSHYPNDERSWLISTAFNTGVECASALQIQDAQQWFEVASMLCHFVADSPLEKVETAYKELLARYGGN